jgi:hypothetical protein
LREHYQIMRFSILISRFLTVRSFQTRDKNRELNFNSLGTKSRGPILAIFPAQEPARASVASCKNVQLAMVDGGHGDR